MDMNNGVGIARGSGDAGWRGGKVGKNADNCNSIINKIQFFKKIRLFNGKVHKDTQDHFRRSQII